MPRSPLLLLALLALAPGCSFADGDGALPFRSLASVSNLEAAEPLAVVRSEADEAALRARVGLEAPLGVDYGSETVLAVSTDGAGPATNYEIAVTGLEAEAGGGVLVTAEVRRVGNAGGDAETYPVAVVAVDRLGSVTVGDQVESRVLVRRVGAADCAL